MTPENLTAIAGILLSLVFSYVPGLKDWYAQLTTEIKRVVMLVLLVVVTGGVLAIACAGYAPDLSIAVACDRAGIVLLIKAFVAALIANQAAYLITKG
jgi:hypothetical protein